MDMKEYLLGLYKDITYDPKWLRVENGNGKYMMSTIAPDGEENVFSRITHYRVIYETILDLDFKVKLSFKNAIESGASVKLEEFNPFHAKSMDEELADYYLENAIFRLSSLWDMLAQLYRLYYRLKIQPYKVNYGRLFTNEKNVTLFGKEGEQIKDYLEQIESPEDNLGDDYIMWKGNHKFMQDFRNQMTHRNSPNLTSISDFGISLRNPPLYTAKRLVEDYVMVSKFIADIIKKIDKEIMTAVPSGS